MTKKRRDADTSFLLNLRMTVNMIFDGTYLFILSVSRHSSNMTNVLHFQVKTDLKGPVGVWYSARVLDITDSKAFVCYNELLNNEGNSLPFTHLSSCLLQCYIGKSR